MKKYYLLLITSFFIFSFSVGHYIDYKYSTLIDGFWSAKEIKKRGNNSSPIITERNLKIDGYSFKSTIVNKGGNDHHIIVYEYSGKLNPINETSYDFISDTFTLQFPKSSWNHDLLSETYQRKEQAHEHGTGKVLYYRNKTCVVIHERQQKIVIYNRLT